MVRRLCCFQLYKAVTVEGSCRDREKEDTGKKTEREADLKCFDVALSLLNQSIIIIQTGLRMRKLGIGTESTVAVNTEQVQSSTVVLI